MTAEELYRSVYRIRRVEEETVRLYPTDAIKSPVHLSIGQEGVSVGVCAALQPDDVVFGTYRGHAAYLAKGGDLKAMVAELFGKVTGCARGKGGSMHLVDVKAGMMGASAVVATGIPQAVGYAFAQKAKRTGAIVATFFGDGAIEEGAFWESLNFAVLHRLPILFVCENNLYAIHSPVARRQPSTEPCTRVAAFGLPAVRVDRDDAQGVLEAARVGVEHARSGAGPYFMEVMTYRYFEHVGIGEDFEFGYRARAEAEGFMARDPVKVAAEALEPEVRERIAAEVEAEVAEAFRYAAESPFPPESELYADVFLEVSHG